MTAREQAAARRAPRLSDDQAQTDPGVVDNSHGNKSEDIWVVNFISRLAGTLRDIATARGKEK
jgi:hypothetical protein